MNRILLTGGSGFFGKYLKPALMKAGELTTIGISESDDLFADLSKEVPSIDGNFDLVVHAAGKAHVVPETEKERQAFYDVNTTGTINLLRALERSDKLPKHIVFISTVAVYGLEKGESIKESEPLKAKEPYGRSKVLAEQYLKKWGRNNNVTISILRLPLLIGKNAPGNLGAMVDAIKNGRFAIINKGDARRSMVYAGDVAEFIPVIAGTEGVYNLTDGYNPSYREFAEVIRSRLKAPSVKVIPCFLAKGLAFMGDMGQKISGKELPFNSRRLLKMTSSLTMDDSKAKKFGWKPSSVVDIVDKWI